MTEQQTTPELRFPGFKDEWVETKLDKLLSFSNGINASKEQYGSGKKFINVLDVLNNNFITYDKIIGKVNVSEEIQNRNKVEYGDILFLRSSETREDVGIANVYLDEEFALYGGFIIRGKKISDYSPLFLKNTLSKPKMRHTIGSNAGGSTRFNVSQDILKKIAVYLPNVEEQVKIDDLFSKLDHQIELEEEKLKLLNEQKKGYMQKLFSQEVRFKDDKGNNYPDWQIVKIGDILEERTERSSEGDMLSVTINNGIIKFDEVDRKDNSSKDKSNYRKVYKNDIAYNSMRMWQGASGKSEYDGIVSPAYTVTVPIESINSDFIAYYFKTHKMIHKFKINSQGLTSDTWNLKYRQLKEIKIYLCLKEEQNKIANLLIAFDKLINRQKNKLEILKTNKKGLLQKMFV